MRGNQFWFELSEVSKNREFEKSGFYCTYNSYICGGRRLIFQGKELCEMKIHFRASTLLNGINYSTIHYHATDYFQYYFLNLVRDKSQKVELWMPYFFSSSFNSKVLGEKNQFNVNRLRCFGQSP